MIPITNCLGFEMDFILRSSRHSVVEPDTLRLGASKQTINKRGEGGAAGENYQNTQQHQEDKDWGDPPSLALAQELKEFPDYSHPVH
jgi:hypothetical protein